MSTRTGMLEQFQAGKTTIQTVVVESAKLEHQQKDPS
jgi:hypothetical protein